MKGPPTKPSAPIATSSLVGALPSIAILINGAATAPAVPATLATLGISPKKGKDFTKGRTEPAVPIPLITAWPV